MKTPLSAVVLLLAAVGPASSASASALSPSFGVVDLGPSYQLRADSTGYVHGVTAGDGSSTYAFDKSPVASISEQVNNPGGHADDSTLYYLQNGVHEAGYKFTEAGSFTGPTYAPTSMALTGGWDTTGGLPVADLNSHGEIVGVSLYSLGLSPGTYAAFSGPTGLTHGVGGGSSVGDNLNNYIAASLGINLTSALKVDDLGRIIAEGTLDGKVEDFLLTPAGVSSDPVPTPEPTALALLAVASAGWAARRRSRR